MEHTTAIIFAALAVIVVVVILTTIRKNNKTEDKKVSLADKANEAYVDRQRQEDAFIESYQWEDDPDIPAEDEWKTKPCKVIQRNDSHKIINTTYEEAYKMVQKYIDMCFERFDGQTSLFWPFIVKPVDDESAIDERDRPSERFSSHYVGYWHKKKHEFDQAKKDNT